MIIYITPGLNSCEILANHSLSTKTLYVTLCAFADSIQCSELDYFVVKEALKPRKEELEDLYRALSFLQDAGVIHLAKNGDPNVKN